MMHPRRDANSPQDIGDQMAALKVLQGLTMQNAIGAACSYLLHCAMKHPELTRRVLNEKVIREGFRGMSLLETLTRVCK